MSIDFDLPPTTPDTEQPTDGPMIDAPVPAPAPQPVQGRQVAHTDGGLPAVPLLVIAGNSAVAGMSATALAVGPAAAIALAAGTAVTAAAATVRSRVKSSPSRRKTSAASSRTSTRAGTSSTGTRRAGAGAGGGASRTSAGARTTGTGASKKTAADGRAGATKTSSTGAGTGGTSGTGTAAGRGSAAQIKALRKDKAAKAGTRKETREKTTGARRGVAEARRQAKASAKAAKQLAKKAPGTRGAAGTGSAAAWWRRNGKHGTAAGRTATKPDTTKKPGKKSLAARAADAKTAAATKAIDGARAAADNRTLTRTEKIRAARTAAKSRATMARKIAGSKGRYARTAVGAALIAAPFVVLGMATTPLGRKLGWRWLQAPGPRMYRRLTANAKAAHLDRRVKAREDHHARLNPAAPDDTTPDTADADVTPEPIADTVPRAPRTGAAPVLTGEEPMSEEIQTQFTEASEELVAAAHAYEPGGMMHVRMTIRSMGPAIEQWGAAFAVLATKTDDDFPLEKEIGEGLEDIHIALMQISDRAEELSQTFDRLHEADIKRITDPRKSTQAEKGWDVTNNEDYDGE